MYGLSRSDFTTCTAVVPITLQSPATSIYLLTTGMICRRKPFTERKAALRKLLCAPAVVLSTERTGVVHDGRLRGNEEWRCSPVLKQDPTRRKMAVLYWSR